MNPLLLTDGYKVGHHLQYPDGTTLVYSNFTPRSNKYGPKDVNFVVSFGQQLMMRRLHELFENDFFNKPKDEVCGEMKRELSEYLGMDYDVTHFEKLHDLGYLPIKVKIMREGTLVPMRVPVLTIYNTLPDFYWVTNYLETIFSSMLWKPITSATIAHKYRQVLSKWQQMTDKEKSLFIDWQGHDFSMRGMDDYYATISSGLGHLVSFSGSDSLPTIHGARKYYNETGFVCGSVNATEHSVMCAGTKEDEVGTFKRLLKIYPTGILSVVSDTWDLWRVCTEYVAEIKEEILARDGKLVIRPDSGDPVDILCGYNIPLYLGENATSTDYYNHLENGIDGKGKKDNLPEFKGVIELLWEVFGGTINEQGYKVLDPHIGAIYGDSITIERADEICRRLESKGFASTNVVLGIGSFTYQFNTRDTFGFAMKATYVEVNGEGREIFKDPITDDGIKKSAKGLLQVKEVTISGSHGFKGIVLVDQVSWEEEGKGLLETLYENGEFHINDTLNEIRERLKQS